MAIQNPDSAYFRSMIASELNTGKETFSDLLKAADSLIGADPYYKAILAHDANYWIIVNRDNTLVGPMYRDEYMKQRDSLHIPSDLTLEQE